jgi:hypothetical protein
MRPKKTVSFAHPLILSMLLCGLVQAQSTSSKVKASQKPKSQASRVELEPKVESAPKPPDISKEFMPIARKAFQSLDNLNAHFWESLDDDAAWTTREVAAENARDDLEGVATTQIEQFIFSSVKADLVFIGGYRFQIKTAEMLGERQGNLYSSYKTAADNAQKGLKDIFENPCYAATKETAVTGDVKYLHECKAVPDKPTKDSASR